MPTIHRVETGIQTNNTGHTSLAETVTNDLPSSAGTEVLNSGLSELASSNAKQVLFNINIPDPEDEKLFGMKAILFNVNYKGQRDEMLVRGLTYDEAYLCWKLKARNEIRKFPDGFWRNRETARNFFFAGIDSVEGFKSVRETSDVKSMVDIYRNKVLKYEAVSHKTNGQTAFYYEVLGLRSFMTGKIDYLRKKGSAAEVVKQFLPQLIDVRNPDALDPLEVEHQYWNDPENARYHILLALDTVPGFTVAYKLGDIKTMAELYRKHVIKYENKTKKVVDYSGQIAFFYEIGGLRGLMTRDRSYLEETGSAKSLLDLSVPGLVDENNPDALKLREVGKDYLNDPELARKYIIEALDTIPGFSEAREKKDIKEMAELYRKNVICYESKDKSKFRWNGQLAFFYEQCKLVSLVCNKREFLERTGSPYAVIHFALPELVDIKNPDALNPLELQRNMSKWKKISIALKILGALDSIPGFLEARLQNDYVKMEKLFRDNVCFYKEYPGAIKREMAFLYEVAGLREEIEPILKEDKDINPLQFYKAALPGFFAHLIQKAFNQAEENKKLIGLILKQLDVPEDPELFDKGFDALIRASLHFDEARGYQFSTLACTYIKKAVNDHLARKRNEISLDATISSSRGDRKEKSLGETISYDDDETPLEFCSDSESKIKLKSVIELALSELNPREQEIIKARFGFNGEEPKSLREVGEIFNVTKERIRQIEGVAIEKLRVYLDSTGINIDSFILD